jgi:hypothetical protein
MKNVKNILVHFYIDICIWHISKYTGEVISDGNHIGNYRVSHPRRCLS